MNENLLALCVFGGYIMIAISIILIWIFIDPMDDLWDICVIGLIWPLALLLLAAFFPFKLLEKLQNKILERRSKKKYYNEDDYRSENEDWYSED